jgi:hypothetical protein
MSKGLDGHPASGGWKLSPGGRLPRSGLGRVKPRLIGCGLEVVKFRNLYKRYSDILQLFERLRLLQNFSLSELGRATDGRTNGVIFPSEADTST